MHPEVWGNSLWKSLVYVVMEYPVKAPTAAQQTAYKAFFDALGPVLPCRVCSRNYITNYKPPDLADRDALLEWLTALHNKSNPRGKSLSSRKMVKVYARECYDWL